MRGRKGAGRFEQFEGSDDIAVQIAARVFNRVANPGLCCKMHHDIRFLGCKEPHQQTGGFYRLVDDVKIRVLLQHCLSALLERDIIIVRQIVDPHNPKALCQKQLAQMIANEA